MFKGDHLSKRLFAVAVVRAGMPGSTGAFAAQCINGAGATLPYWFDSKWNDVCQGKTDIRWNYRAIASGGNSRLFTADAVNIAAYDAPMKPDKVKKNPLV